MWQWSNFFHSHVHPAKTPVRINMDETAVRLCPSMRGGHLTKRAREQKRTPKSLTMNAWMEQANLTKGAAPCSAVFADAVCLSAAEPAHVALNPSAPRKHQSKLQWLRRWRRRWGVSIGKVLAGEKIPVAEAREKARMVRPQKKRAGQFLGAVAPQSGPQKVVRKMDSVLGAQHTK